jgi:hypothetical protein
VVVVVVVVEVKEKISQKLKVRLGKAALCLRKYNALKNPAPKIKGNFIV